MVEGIKSAIIAGVGMAIYVDGQLKIRGHSLESGVCAHV